MSEKTSEKKSLPVAREVEEPRVGEGGRSLANWEKLAAARRDLSGSDKARASLQSDPQAFLAGYGINVQAFAGSGGQAGLTALERQLAFTGGVERDALGVHRGCEAVVGPVALVVAAAAAGVGVAVAAIAAAGVAVVAANTAEAVNAVQAYNVAYTATQTSETPWWGPGS